MCWCKLSFLCEHNVEYSCSAKMTGRPNIPLAGCWYMSFLPSFNQFVQFRSVSLYSPHKWSFHYAFVTLMHVEGERYMRTYMSANLFWISDTFYTAKPHLFPFDYRVKKYLFMSWNFFCHLLNDPTAALILKYRAGHFVEQRGDTRRPKSGHYSIVNRSTAAKHRKFCRWTHNRWFRSKSACVPQTFRHSTCQ